MHCIETHLKMMVVDEEEVVVEELEEEQVVVKNYLKLRKMNSRRLSRMEELFRSFLKR